MIQTVISASTYQANILAALQKTGVANTVAGGILYQGFFSTGKQNPLARLAASAAVGRPHFPGMEFPGLENACRGEIHPRRWPRSPGCRRHAIGFKSRPAGGRLGSGLGCWCCVGARPGGK